MTFRIDDQLNEARVALLEHVLNAAFSSNKAQLGRRLGYKDGSFIGQMLRRERPITEATLLSIIDLHEVRSLDLSKWLRPANRPIVVMSVGTGKSSAMLDQVQEVLEGWRATASPKSREVIDRLSLLAKKNRLRDEDWQLIDNMVLRLAQQPKDSKTHSLP